MKANLEVLTQLIFWHSNIFLCEKLVTHNTVLCNNHIFLSSLIVICSRILQSFIHNLIAFQIHSFNFWQHSEWSNNWLYSTDVGFDLLCLFRKKFICLMLLVQGELFWTWKRILSVLNGLHLKMMNGNLYMHVTCNFSYQDKTWKWITVRRLL